MAGSSPARGSSTYWPSPESHRRLPEYLSENRNNELSHKEALAAAAAEHERVREAALRVIELHAKQLEQERLRKAELEIIQKQQVEVERLKQERKVVEAQRRLEALKVEKHSPAPTSEKAETAKAVVNGSSNTLSEERVAAALKPNPFAPSVASPIGTQRTDQINGHTANGAKPSISSPSEVSPSVPQQTPVTSSPFAKSTTPATNSSAKPAATAPNPFGKPQASTVNPFAKTASPAATSTANPFGKPATTPAVNGVSSAASAPAQAATALTPARSQAHQGPDRYTQIHQNLKKLRVHMLEHAKRDTNFKKLMGDMRREIRKCVGQLTTAKNANKDKSAKIKTLLLAARDAKPPSPLIDPADYIHDEREPVQGVEPNGQLSSLFIYLLNHFSKAMINQFIGECAVSPDHADPVGVVAAQIFSTKEFQWRGGSLIDIMMAKFRVACPVLFGFRGSEKTEQGRARLGWKKTESGQWLDAQSHTDRMKGLGVGYASIALRDFSRSQNINPWPPAKYWTSVASIVNTPAAEISDTQCAVLRAMIWLYEDKFIGFYGSNAIAALRKALVEFPLKVPNKSPAVSSLQVLAQQYLKDQGLDLR
ncbi:putative RNA export mediator protein [Xylariales sp. AK1849]|nr:putative RNA export mediator protein [Xylariales sp. AK1849]